MQLVAPPHDGGKVILCPADKATAGPTGLDADRRPATSATRTHKHMPGRVLSALVACLLLHSCGQAHQSWASTCACVAAATVVTRGTGAYK
jgi:hypothetical protein